LSDTARVNMIWPKDLKDRVTDKNGPRGLTEFTLEAVEVALQGGADELKRLEKELNETKHLAQLLADRIVMGGSSVDRLEAFMELELPTWLDTSGWPSEMAKRVPTELPELPPAVVDEPGPVDAEEAFVEPEEPTDWINDPETTPEEKIEKFEELEPQVTTGPPSGDELPDDFFEKKVGAGDLFARVMEKTGNDPLMNSLKPASEIPQPEPKVEKDVCPTCGDELVSGECWTCG
jgi:hypothetical protein